MRGENRKGVVECVKRDRERERRGNIRHVRIEKAEILQRKVAPWGREPNQSAKEREKSKELIFGKFASFKIRSAISVKSFLALVATHYFVWSASLPHF